MLLVGGAYAVSQTLGGHDGPAGEISARRKQFWRRVRPRPMTCASPPRPTRAPPSDPAAANKRTGTAEISKPLSLASCFGTPASRLLGT